MVPHELTQRHPAGFRFALHDCTCEKHAEAQAAAIARAAAGGAKVGSLADLDGAAALLAPQRPEQLLRTLPEVVVGDSGGLVPVRSELAQMLGAAPPRAARAPVASTAAQAQHDAQAVREARLRRFGGAEQAR